MNLIVNDTQINVAENLTLKNLLSDMNISDARGMAIAVNDTVVPRIQWDVHRLLENDQILLIKATQGG